MDLLVNSNGCNSGIKSFYVLWKRVTTCLGCVHFITDRELLTNWSLSAEPQMQDQTRWVFFFFFSILCSGLFVVYFFLCFSPFFISPTTQLISPQFFFVFRELVFTLSLCVFWLFSLVYMFWTTTFLFLHLCAYVMSLLFLLRYLPLIFSTWPLHSPASLLHIISLCLVEVEPFVGMPRRRPLSLCPCWSPEGNTTLLHLWTVVAGYLVVRICRTGLPPFACSSYPRPYHTYDIRLSTFPQNSPKAY